MTSKRIDLTGDRALTRVEARRLARWWAGGRTSVELFRVRRNRFRVVATIFSPGGRP